MAMAKMSIRPGLGIGLLVTVHFCGAWARDVFDVGSRQLQGFFEDDIDFSCQVYLPLGVARSDQDSQPRVCTVCSVLPWARSASNEQICRLDVSNCTLLQPGEQCTIRCREPYYAGDPVTAMCPWDNSEESGGGLTWEEPKCEIQCPDFEGGPPAGYSNQDGTWECALGYIGKAEYRCTLHDDCVARPSLSGCTALIPCQLPIAVDTCMLNFSTCYNLYNSYPVMPESRTSTRTCQVGCNAPNWAGTPTVATCKAGNVDPSTPLNWTIPTCQASCPPGTPVPEGYLLENGIWRCADTHFGTPVPICTVNEETCVAEWRPTGCDLMHPCVAPDDDLCRYDMSECLNVLPGGSCLVRCREPFVGGASIATCLENNIDPNKELTWTPPRPSCALLLCPELERVPVGYERRSDGWRCAPGYTGDAKAFCEVQSSTCFAETVLSGCVREAPCWPLEVDTCMMDASSCNGVNPGDVCMVRCKAPYTGTPAPARCPAQNTDPWAPVVWVDQLPNCSLPSCPDPVAVPRSYALVDGKWSCAAGFAGKAEVLCRHGSDCQPSPGELAGCGNPSACVAPTTLTCSVNMSECATVLPGQSCHVHCLYPFQGPPTVAECPLDNLDPAGLRWRPPDCVQFCPDPEVSAVPAGYYKTGAGWACALGYRGTAKKVCSMDERCMSTATVLEGCFEEVPCATLPQQAACGFDVSDCREVPAGGSCAVHCKAPFFMGPSSQAFCPFASTNPNQMLLWTPQECKMECPPAQSATGYAWSEDDSAWICAPGWTGTVKVVCSMENCDVSPSTLTGCVRLQSCTVPEADPCLYTFDCGIQEPGTSCAAQCRPPYVGQATVAQCPAGNTMMQPLIWTPPDCSCPDPSPIPEGYLKSEKGWHCAPGFVGQAVKSCNSTRTCFSAPQLWGCAKVHGCLPLDLDNCEFDFSNCSNVQSGESCEIKCNPPYVLAEGSNGRADCPADNVNRFERMSWTLPTCRLDCPEVNPVPVAYQRMNGSWVCAAGYAGSVQVDCYLSSYCSSEPSLQGCSKQEPCFPIELDQCVFDTSGCRGSGCNVGCKSPYQGVAPAGSCPPGNLLPNFWPTFSLPDCQLPEGCLDPLPIPVGYVKTADGWRCDKGYSGTVHVQCVLGDATCQQLQPVLTGCSLIRPCKMPPVDMCIYDLSDCGDTSVPDATSCVARCRLPYNGTVTSAFCPEGNTDPDQVLIWTQPHCELVDCLDPMPIPSGYTKQLDGSWSCSDGYTGVVDGCCDFDSICMPRLTLCGCYPTGPCAMPSPDVCEFDLNDCPTVPLGFSCSIRCQFPYSGVASLANCSEGADAPPLSERSLKMPARRCTTGPSSAIILPQQLYYTLPNCSCPDPFVTPDGYEKNGTVWQCARGYAGNPELLCQDGDVCLTEPTLRGCLPLQQCKEPDVDPADRCRYDISDCVQYPPRAGETCIIRCLSPYEGTFGFAGCPADNTVFNRSSIWLENVPKPVCNLNCPDPSNVPFGFIYIMPEGYMKDGADNWMCAPGYAGTVTFYCAFGPNCTLINEPAGCLPFAPCNGLITTSAIDNCSLETILCDGIGPGVSCNVHCKPPYVGPPGEAICPYNNTDPTTQVEWTYLPACYCPDTCQEQPGYLKIVEDPSIYFRRLFHLGAADAAGPFQCADGYLGSPLLECRRDSECFDEVTLFGCDKIIPCIAPRLSPLLPPPPENFSEELPFQEEAIFAAANPTAVVPWVPRAQDGIPEHCLYDLSDCYEVGVGSTCKVSCLWPLLPEETEASCPSMNTQERRMVDWTRPKCVLGQCVDPNPLPEGMEKTPAGYRCALGYAGEITFQCIPSSVREGCGTQAVPSGCRKMQSCGAPVVDKCSHDVSDCENVPTGGSCVIRCRYPFSGFSTVGSCPTDNTIENRPVDWTQQVCLSSACPIPRIMPEGYAIARDGSFICAQGYMGSVTTACSHDPNRDCAANDLSFAGCVPSRSCNRCLDPSEPRPPGYVRDPQTMTWSCDVGYKGTVAERCDSCTQPVILGGCVPLVSCLPPQAEHCVFDVLDCWNLPSGAECQVFVRKPFVGNTTIARCPAGNTDFAQEAIWDGSIENASCPDPVPPPGYVKVDGSWICDASSHRGTAELRCKAPDRCLREAELVGCRSLQACAAPDLPDPCAIESGCEGILPGEECNVTCREPYVGDIVVGSCDPDNIRVNAKVEIDSLPQCSLRCPDPPETPEGYAKDEKRGWHCAEGYGGTPSISCVRRSEDPLDCELNITISGCLPLVSCAAPVVDQCSTYIPEDCNFTAGSSCHVYCGRNFRMQEPASFPQVDWFEDPNATDFAHIPEWFDFGDVVPYAIATCPANNTDPMAMPLWSPAPRCTLECPYPSVPPGYREIGNNRWSCEEGYTGRAILDCTLWENCSVTSWLSGCDELVSCALPAVDDPCVYDFDSYNCSRVFGGETCEVTCKSPYAGPQNTIATCPDLNIDPQRPLDWEPPVCNYTCSEPDPIPAGYVKATAAQISLGAPEWICATGYSGEAVATCNIDQDCLAIIALSGCLPIVACKMPDVDTCMYDLSGCTAMLPGQFCFVGCLAPYVLIGQTTFASCPSTNTDPNKDMDWTPPVCDCPGPTTLPAGYGRAVANSLTSYSCLSGYVGDAVVNCSVPGESCLTEAQFGGCIPTVPCVVPTVDQCRMDTSDCGSEVAPGSTCSVSCGVYLGNSTTASCPQTNIDPSGLVIPEDFQCDCPDPSTIPTGYARSSGGWQCADLYVGEVLHTCSTDASCTMQVQLDGCEELQPCQSVDSNCLYDASNCSGVMPGETCDIFCQEPYVGTPTIGSCPQGNTATNTSLTWTAPICNHSVCPVPEFQSVAGYELQTVSGKQSWQCASGYGGQAVESCPISVDSMDQQNCSSETVLIGCLPVVGCVKPSADTCVYNTSECDNLGAGQFCVLRCQTNYEGTATGGYCLASNTNPNRLVEWSRPSCRMVCPDPVPMPAGYVRSNVTGFLECAPGYWGSVISQCSRNFPFCDITTVLSGCLELFPCANPEIDTCIYDFNPSTILWGGESLTIQCRRPYRGFQSVAMCPPNNLDPTRPFLWFPGDCFCPDPCPIPHGYFKAALGYDNWICAQGYTGTSSLGCGSAGKCQDQPLLSGCTKTVPCARLNLTDYRCDVELEPHCEALQPGQSCRVACAAPYTGADVMAICPQDNVDELAQPLLQGELDCVLESCNATDEVPVGYVKTHDGWKCDKGYGGTPAVHCRFSVDGAFQGGRGCGLEMSPSGCKPLVPCVPPSSLEGCKYDTSGCGAVLPGQECQLKCRKPYSGLGVFATCPGDNTDPTQEVILPQGSFLDCNCPAPAQEFIPPGYTLDASNDWVCGPGFAGTAVKRCERPDECLNEPEFLGCLPLQPCIIPDVDTCMFDLSDCVNVMPGETCSIYCVPPYKQDQVQNATCIAENTDPLQPIEWEAGRCDLAWEDCVDPLPLPIGYEKKSDGFHCAAGYVGVVEVSPTVHCGPWHPNCDSTPKLTGCFPLESCRPVRFHDDCSYNTSLCPDTFLPGDECEVLCKAPYVGNPSVARCSSRNIEWQGAFEWTPAQCVCPNPRTVPEGYFLNTSGWFCDTNNSFEGSAQVVCSQPGFCLSEPMLVGCQKAGPCVAPLLDHCVFDASSCEGVEISQQCVISCAAGYIGPSTTAFCENPGGQFGLQYTEPLCQLDFCPDPDVMPGYVRNTSGWFCADGFEGTATKSCSHDATCRISSRLSGCLPIQMPCRLPNLDCRYDMSNCSSITQGQYCEVKCVAPFAGKPSTAVCPPGTDMQSPEELLVTLPYCDLEGCPDPDPIPLGYRRVGEIFTCTDGFVGQAVMQCSETQACQYVLSLSGCTNATDLAISFAQLTQAPSQQDFVPCQAAEICGEPDDVPPGYDKFLGQWRCSSGFAGTAGIQCSAQRNCQSTPTLSGCVPIETCLPIIADGCDIDVSDCRSVLGGEKCEIKCKDPYTGPSTFATCPAGNINTSEVLTWVRPKCELTNCPQGLVVRDGYVKDSIKGWICANGFRGDASVNCSINAACEAECVYGGCVPIEVCVPPAADACQFNWTDCDGILPDRSCIVSCMPPYVGPSTMATCRATAPWGPNLTSMSPPELDWIQPTCQCPEPLPAPGYLRVDDTWQCDEGFGGAAGTRCQRPLECLDAPELFGCLPLQPCIPPISTARCEALDLSNCSEVPTGETCEVLCVAPFVGAPSTASCPAENLIPNQVLTMPVEPCVLGCEDPPVHPGYKKDGEGWRCDTEDGFTGTANVFCELDADCGSIKKFQGCIPSTRPCVAPSLDLCKYDVSDCLSVSPGATCVIACAGNYAGKPMEARCPPGNVLENGLIFKAPRCVAEDIDCPLPAVLPQGYKLNGKDLVCEDDYIGSFVSRRCGHDSACNKVLELTGCVKPVKCSPLKIEPCERDNLGCWDVEAGSSCFIECKPPFFGASSLASCPAGNTDPTTPLAYDLSTCLCSDPPDIPPGFSQDLFGEWSCQSGYSGAAVKRCRVGEICIPDSQLVGCEKLEPCRDLTPTSCDQDVSDCTNIEPGGTCFVTCRQPWTSIESTLGSCPSDNVDPTRTVTWTPPTCELRCPVPNPMPDGFEWDGATATARCKTGYLGPASTSCIINNETCEVTTFVSGCQKLMPCKLPLVDQCKVNMTQCRNVMPGESCRPRCIPPFELYGPAPLAECPENNLDADRELEWLQLPNCSVFDCEDPSPVPAGYEFGINPNDPVAVGLGIPRWYCAIGYVGTAERVCSGNATCGVIAFLSGCLPIMACRAPVVDTCRVDDSRCGSIRPGSRCTLSCRPPFVGTSTVASCSVRNTEPDGLLFRSPSCTLPANFDPIPLGIGFSSTYEGFRCGVGYAGRIQTICRMQAGCRTTTYPEGCAPPVPCKVGNFQDEDGRLGFISGNISFGRAQLDTMLNAGQARDFRSTEPLRFSGKGMIYEDEVDSYDIYFVDSCNRTVGDALTSVSIKDATDQILCCDDSVYNVSLSVAMPEEVKGLAVIAKIRNSLGLQPSVNYWVLSFEDRIDPITNVARRWSPVAPLALMALWLLGASLSTWI